MLWSALAEFRYRQDPGLLGAHLVLGFYKDLTLILTFLLQPVRCGFAPWEPPSGAWVAGSPSFVQSLFGRTKSKRRHRRVPPCIAPCPPRGTVMGSVLSGSLKMARVGRRSLRT